MLTLGLRPLRDFHTKLMDSMHSSFNLGEPIPNFKVKKKKKKLSSLSKRFRANVIAIEEFKDVELLKMNLESPRKGKLVALNAIKEQSLSSKSDDVRKCQSENLQGLLKKFKKYMKLEKSKKKLNDAKKIEKINGKREKYGERHGKRASN